MKRFVFVLFVILFIGCPNNQKLENLPKMFSINFSVQNNLGGAVSAKLKDGLSLSSGDRQNEGVKVVFTATANEFYEFERWNIKEGNNPELEIVLKEDINLIAIFKMKNDKPKLNNGEVKIFQINGVGRDSIRPSTFDSSFESHVEDGSNPLFLFDGDVLKIKIGCWKGTKDYPIKDVLFKFDEDMPTTITTTKDSTSTVIIEKYSSIWEKGLEDEKEHNIYIEIHPTAVSSYSPIVYRFKVKKSGLKLVVPEVRFYINNRAQKIGHKEEFSSETILLSIQTYENNIKDVEIGTIDDLVKVEIHELQATKTIYEAKRVCNLPTDDYKKFIIRANPKDETMYRPAEYFCELKGIKVQNNNAEFEYVIVDSEEKPNIIYDIKFYDGKVHPYIDCYGALSAKITTKTLSPRAKVMCSFVDKENTTLMMPDSPLAEEKQMQSDGKGSHTLELKFYPNKPTIFCAYVIAEDGSKNNEKGKLTYTFNDISARWSKKLGEKKGQKFADEAYDSIKIKKADFDSWELTDNKKEFEVAFKTFKEGLDTDTDYALPTTFTYPQYQSAFRKLNIQGMYQWYVSKINITDLKENAPYEISFPISEKGNLCFEYKMKVEIIP